jgi:hypothetical protein
MDKQKMMMIDKLLKQAKQKIESCKESDKESIDRLIAECYSLISCALLYTDVK